MSNQINTFVPSIVIFRRYIKLNVDGEYEVSDILSKTCYKVWLTTRKKIPKDPVHAFRKAVTGHCRGDVGLKPFKPLVEEKVLKLLRAKKVWPCFKDTKYQIGLRGFQTLGYWEKQNIEKTELTRKRNFSQTQSQNNLSLGYGLSTFNCSTSNEITSIKFEIDYLQTVIDSCMMTLKFAQTYNE